MKLFLSAILILLSIATNAQGFLTLKSIKMDFTGFVRNDFIFDSRKNCQACDHLLEFYPLPPQYDDNGEDINAQPSAHLLNTFTRFGTRFSGLEMGNAKIGAYVEVDFTGSTATNSLRLRHAYTNIVWPKTTLLIGRAWHPTFIEKVYPSTLGENTGLPFQVFNRTPQVRLTHKLTDNFDFIAGAVYQFNYVNDGPEGKSYIYQRNAVIPNLHAQLQYYDEHWTLGAAFDWKSIQPRTSTTGTTGTFKTTQKLNTIAALAYLKYTENKFELKAKTMFGQNVSESLLPGGYAVASINTLTGAETYTPFNHIYNWINVLYGGDLKFGLYAGYLKNLGTTEDPLDGGAIYGQAPDIDMIYKISPQLIYNFKNFMFGWEVSLTSAGYGTNDYSDKGKVKGIDNVTNFRNMLSIAYNF
jgi:hypothetical protein